MSPHFFIHVFGIRAKILNTMPQFFQQVHVEFMDSGNAIKIEGPPDEADKARDILDSAIDILQKAVDTLDKAIDGLY